MDIHTSIFTHTFSTDSFGCARSQLVTVVFAFCNMKVIILIRKPVERNTEKSCTYANICTNVDIEFKMSSYFP